MLDKYFVPFDRAKKLKGLKFKEECFGYYIDVEVPSPFLVKNIISDDQGGYFTLAPLFCQIFDWFREKYGLSHEIHLKMSNNKRKIWYNINELDNRLIKSMYFKSYPKGMFETYEEAQLACLDKLIEICSSVS